LFRPNPSAFSLIDLVKAAHFAATRGEGRTDLFPQCCNAI